MYHPSVPEFKGECEEAAYVDAIRDEIVNEVNSRGKVSPAKLSKRIYKFLKEEPKTEPSITTPRKKRTTVVKANRIPSSDSESNETEPDMFEQGSISDPVLAQADKAAKAETLKAALAKVEAFESYVKLEAEIQAKAEELKSLEKADAGWVDNEGLPLVRKAREDDNEETRLKNELELLKGPGDFRTSNFWTGSQRELNLLKYLQEEAARSRDLWNRTRGMHGNDKAGSDMAYYMRESERMMKNKEKYDGLVTEIERSRADGKASYERYQESKAAHEDRQAQIAILEKAVDGLKIQYEQLKNQLSI